MDPTKPALVPVVGCRTDLPRPLDNPVAIVGSGGHCDIHVALPEVADTHCALVCDQKAMIFRSLAGDGVVVNNRREPEGVLNHGDVIAIGPASFRLAMPDPVPADPPALCRSATLCRAGYSQRGDSYDLARRVTTVGSAEACDVRLAADGVAPLQCLLVRTSSGIYLRDLGSDGATLVNGAQAAIRLLEADDEILIGPCVFRLRMGDLVGIQSSAAGGEVLIVDPDCESREILGRILRSAGHGVRAVTSAHEFLERMEQHQAELVILGSQLPDLGTMQLCKTIRKDARWSDAAVIITAHRSICETTFAAGFEAGACDFLIHPLVRAEVLARVGSRLRESRDRQRFRDLASVDALTGLLNRRAMETRIAEAISAARRRQHPVGVAMIDLDHFKRCNDEYGHDFGDRVLRAFSQMLRQNLRQEDILARYGGEEFVIVLPHTSLANTYMLADRLRLRWARTIFEAGGRTFNVTASFGVACFDPTDGKDEVGVDHLVREADVALYAAKRHGRNRVVSASSVLAGAPMPAPAATAAVG